MSITLIPSREDLTIVVLEDTDPTAIAAATHEQTIIANKEATLKAAKSKIEADNNSKLVGGLKKNINSSRQKGLAANTVLSASTGTDAFNPDDPFGVSRFTNPSRTFKQRLNKLQDTVSNVALDKATKDGKIINLNLDTYNEVIKKTS